MILLGQKKRLAREHLNSKEYLKNLAKNLNESDNLEVVLKETLNQIKPPKEAEKCPKSSEHQSSQSGSSRCWVVKEAKSVEETPDQKTPSEKRGGLEPVQD